MASSSIDVPGSAGIEHIMYEKDKDYGYSKEKHEEAQIESASLSVKLTYDSTHRQLRPRHIQLMGIGGTIGTALYVQIGHGLINGGPASLFMAFTIWYVFVMEYFQSNNCCPKCLHSHNITTGAHLFWQ